MADTNTETLAQPRTTADIIGQLTGTAGAAQDAGESQAAAKPDDSQAKAQSEPASKDPGTTETPPEPALNKEQMRLVRQQAQQERGNAVRQIEQQLKAQNEAFDTKLGQLADTLTQLVETRPQQPDDSDELLKSIQQIKSGDIADPEQIGNAFEKVLTRSRSAGNPDITKQVRDAIGDAIKPLAKQVAEQKGLLDSQKQETEVSQFWTQFAKKPENADIDGPALFDEAMDDADLQGLTGETARSYAQGMFKAKLDAARIARDSATKPSRKRQPGTPTLKTQGATTTQSSGEPAATVEYGPGNVPKGIWKPD